MTTQATRPATELIPSARALARRNWGWVLAAGIIGVIVGVLALALPGATVFALAMLLGFGLIVQAVVEFTAFARAADGAPGRGWALFFGIVALAAGLVVLFQPGAGLFAIILGVTLWFVVSGVNELVAGFTFRENRAWNIALGVLSLIAAVVLIVNPGMALGTAALLAGVLFIVRGVAQIVLSMYLRKLAS